MPIRLSDLTDLVRRLKPYSKAIVAAGGFAVLLGKALADGAISGDELMQLLVAAGVTGGVHQVRNTPKV